MRGAALCLALLAAPSLAHAQTEVLMVGSSSVNGAAGRTVETELGRWGYSLVRRSRGASGFARPDFYDWQAQVPRLAPLDRYAMVIVLTGGNDVQALHMSGGDWIAWRDEEAWTREYTARVRDFIDALCDRGAPRVVMLLPVNGGRPGWSARIPRVRQAQIAGARASRCGEAIDPGDDEFEALDGVHLNWTGARRMWARIEDDMYRALGLDQI
ncbi:MAG: DUF459 domain-containing protein [Sandaracinaceae bacterium]|nr:DUF459 domain-containing protein [Sandaracinaceae bacterium]